MSGGGPTLPNVTPRGAHSHPDSLVARAQQKLWQREQVALQNGDSLDAKRERVGVVLMSAMEIVAEDNSDASISELERAVEAAQVIAVLPELRVKARKLLSELQSDRKRRQGLEKHLARLIKQAEVSHEEHMKGMDPGDGTKQSSPARIKKLATARHRAATVLVNLRQAADDAKMQDLNPDLVLRASELIQTIEQDQNYEDTAELKLKRLLRLNDPEKIEAKLQLAKERDEAKGPKALRVISEVEEHVNKLLEHDFHQRWLEDEIAAAVGNRNAHRLRQLTEQGRLMDLRVSPRSIQLLHDWEAHDVQPIEAPLPGDEATLKPARSEMHKVSDRINALISRKQEHMEQVLRFAEDDPSVDRFDVARKAISDAKATKVPREITMEMERRLVAMEDEYGPRLRAEANLLQVLRSLELVTFDAQSGNDGGPVLQDMSKITVLRNAVAEAEKVGVVEDLLHAGEALLERSIAFELEQREAAEKLREMGTALSRLQVSTEQRLADLHRAIDQASRCGLPTLQAERELLKLRDEQVHREAAEAELREARKGQGANGKARLEAAIQSGKTAGVSARKLRSAVQRMGELESHQKKCALVAGNIHRILPILDQEPWRFQQIVENARDLQPWTPELDKLVRSSTEHLEKNVRAQLKQKELHLELSTLLKKISTARSSGQSVSEEVTHLEQLIPKAKEAHLDNAIIQEAKQQLKVLKREGCQLNAAEHRLRLALNSKDFGEIERSLREVRALGGVLIENSSSGPRSDQPRQMQSARLMDSANSMLRHLGDMATRRQAAEAALLQRIAATSDDPLPFSEGLPDPSHAITAVAQQGSDAWVKEIMEVVHEAKQSGVAPTLIEHAKMKIRQKRRERWDEAQAVAALKKTLQKKNASTQELLSNMRKVERFQAKPATARGESGNNRS